MGLLSRKKQVEENSERCSREVIIQNRNGLHARPAAMLVKVSSRFRSDIWIDKDGERVNGKSIMGLMMLAAGKGSKLQILAEGNDAERAVQEIQDLIEGRFGEE